MKQVYPQTPLQKEIGTFETLLSIGKAERILGYEPKFSWRGQANEVI